MPVSLLYSLLDRGSPMLDIEKNFEIKKVLTPQIQIHRSNIHQTFEDIKSNLYIEIFGQNQILTTI
jgi:hypothetical protein